MDDGILKVSNGNPQEKTRTKKDSPGDSSRDLFIPTRWRSRLQPLKGSRELTIPKRSRLQNCQGNETMFCVFLTTNHPRRVLQKPLHPTSLAWSNLPIRTQDGARRREFLGAQKLHAALDGRHGIHYLEDHPTYIVVSNRYAFTDP